MTSQPGGQIYNPKKESTKIYKWEHSQSHSLYLKTIKAFTNYLTDSHGCIKGLEDIKPLKQI